MTDDESRWSSDDAAKPGPPRSGGPLIPRRVFLTGAVGTSALAALQPTGFWRTAAKHATRAVLADVIVDSVPVPDLVISVEREQDLVLLDFLFYGFEVVPPSVDTGAPTSIAPTTSTNVLTVQFPPQALGEGVYVWDQDVLNVDPPPILSELSGPSRLCFNLPLGQGGIPLPTMTAAELLDWSGWELLVPQNAEFTGLISTYVDPYPPGFFESQIEFPNGLFIAPVVGSGSLAQADFTTTFTGPAQPLVSSQGVVDLWSTTLVSSANGSGAPLTPTIAAVWAADYPASGPVPDDTPETYINYQPVIT